MIYIYLKRHNKTGLKYLGQTKSRDPHVYKGSGKYWKNHIKTHGYDVTTEVLKVCTNKEEVRYWGEYYTTYFNIIDSEEWANLKPESGDGGWPPYARKGKRHTDKTRKKISENTKGRSKKGTPRTDSQKEHLSRINKGKPRSRDSIQKQLTTRLQHPYKHSEEIKEKMKQPKTIDHRLNMKKSQRKRRKESIGSMWITNGQWNKLIKSNESIPDGWTKGRIVLVQPPSQKGKVWINDGNISKMSMDVPAGWSRGRLKKEVK